MGLAINLFYMNDFEGARVKIVSALKATKGEGENVCMTWLGIVNIYLAVQVGLRLSCFTNKSDPEYKELIVSRDNALLEAVKILNSTDRY
jgi:hypothetical protein